MTMNGADPLLSEEENTAHEVEPPTEEEMNAAITKNMGRLMTVVGLYSQTYGKLNLTLQR